MNTEREPHPLSELWSAEDYEDDVFIASIGEYDIYFEPSADAREVSYYFVRPRHADDHAFTGWMFDYGGNTQPYVALRYWPPHPSNWNSQKHIEDPTVIAFIENHYNLSR